MASGINKLTVVEAQNTALGQAALYANTCEHCNVAVGGLALRFNTEGN